MLRSFVFCTLLSLLLFSCLSDSSSNVFYEEINGRDGQPLYRIQSPSTFVKKEMDDSYFHDTTKPNYESQAFGSIRVTIHQFPGLKIPHEAQFMRWQQQFTTLEHSEISPQSFSGYVGFKLEAFGKLENMDTFMIGWSLRLAPEFLSRCDSQRGADVTIKIVGPKNSVTAYKEELEKVARSFELIEEFPL